MELRAQADGTLTALPVFTKGTSCAHRIRLGLARHKWINSWMTAHQKVSDSPTRSRLGRVMVCMGINGNTKESSDCRRCCGRRVLRGQGAAVG